MWDAFKPKENIWYRWRLNGADAYLKKAGNIWQTAFKIIPFQERIRDFGGPEKEDPPESLPITLAWGAGREVSLHPYLSTQPYLITVPKKMRIGPGWETRFTAALPPVLKFELAPETALAEAMPFILSQTWSGSDTMEGELCHSLSGGLLPYPGEQTALSLTLIACDILIKNNAKTLFELEHFAVYPEPLSVYLYKGRLVSDTLELDFFGTDHKITIGQKKSPDHRILSAGIKSNVRETIARRSVDIIRHLTRI